MWSDAFDKPLRLELAVSHYLAVLIVATHLLGLMAAVFGPWNAPIGALLGMCVLVSGVGVAWWHLLDGRITMAVWLPDGRWRVFGAGCWRDARLGPGVRWSTLWVVLPLQLPGKNRRTLILGRDAIDPDAFRRLRGRLTVLPHAKNGAK